MSIILSKDPNASNARPKAQQRAEPLDAGLRLDDPWRCSKRNPGPSYGAFGTYNKPRCSHDDRKIDPPAAR